MQWNLRMKAAEAGIWQATQMRRRLAEAGLEISAGKMSMLWSRTPTTIRLDDLEVLCAVLNCTPCDLLVPAGLPTTQPEQAPTRATGTDPALSRVHDIVPKPGRPRSSPPL
ncbi:helix-turn-helix domain-containing protein [Streptomyces sp. NPDC127084]|uniref:helix-turn-helix domain-containing protein n=1 Tax=Streptomyces sp. NPDC127084 TaxID=3347133 RepID=UPI00365FD3FB